MTTVSSRFYICVDDKNTTVRLIIDSPQALSAIFYWKSKENEVLSRKPENPHKYRTFGEKTKRKPLTYVRGSGGEGEI